jgi:hypothetical protein
MVEDPFKPAARVAGQRQDVWWVNIFPRSTCSKRRTDVFVRSIVNEAAEESKVKPMVNMYAI